MNRQRTFSGSPWESKVGYCRALRVGSHIFVTGTVAVDGDGRVHALNDGYAQTLRCFEIIERALADVGARLEDVVRTRMFVTDISRWEEFGRAHEEVFRNGPPATSMIEVSALIEPGYLIEVEAEAMV